MTELALIIRLLDMVHDVLCPFFRDNKKTEDLDKIEAKLTEIETLIL